MTKANDAASSANGHHPETVDPGDAFASMEAWRQIPPLPGEAWHPLHRSIREWLEPQTEAPFEYMFASAHVLLGLAIGRNAFIHAGRNTYTNEFAVLIGPPAMRKGTPIALLMGLVLDAIIDPGDWNRHTVRGTGSAEGLLEQFMEEAKEVGDRGRPRKILKPVPERRVLHIEEEFGYLLVKAHSQATTNLREPVNDDHPGDAGSPTRGR